MIQTTPYQSTIGLVTDRMLCKPIGKESENNKIDLQCSKHEFQRQHIDH